MEAEPVRDGLEEFAGDAVAAARWTRGVLAEGSRTFLQSLRPQGERDGAELFHGSPRDPVWEYVLSAEAARVAGLPRGRQIHRAPRRMPDRRCAAWR